MIIVETPTFTKRVLEVLSDDEYRALQLFLASNPDSGDLIKGTGGLRKLRWGAAGNGKRGGARIIYYWFKPKESLLMLFLFKKNESDDLTDDQRKKLMNIVAKELP